MLKIGIYGAKGRMGKMIATCLENEEKAKAETFYDLGDDIKDFFSKSELIIDFSTLKGTKALLKEALNSHKALVIGTTGLDASTCELIKKLSLNMPILQASNMSLGIAVLKALSFKAAKMLKDFDIEIFEAHHRHKIDAPSGTALTLAKSVAKARGLELESSMVVDRSLKNTARKKQEIGMMSLRGGDIAGKHTVGFYEDGEFLELSHTATSRATFAKGAIKAALWLKDQPNGLYDIDDCLGL